MHHPTLLLIVVVVLIQVSVRLRIDFAYSTMILLIAGREKNSTLLVRFVCSRLVCLYMFACLLSTAFKFRCLNQCEVRDLSIHHFQHTRRVRRWASLRQTRGLGFAASRLEWAILAVPRCACANPVVCVESDDFEQVLPDRRVRSVAVVSG